MRRIVPSPTLILAVALLCLVAGCTTASAASAELRLTGTLASVVDEGATCTARLVVGPNPGDVLDLRAGGCACQDLLARAGRAVEITGHCLPELTAGGYLCRPVADRVNDLAE